MALYTINNQVYNEKGELQYGGANAPGGTYVTSISSLADIPNINAKYTSMGIDPSGENRSLIDQESAYNNRLSDQLRNAGLKNIEQSDISALANGGNINDIVSKKNAATKSYSGNDVAGANLPASFYSTPTAPISASNINQVGNMILPGQTPTTGNTSSAMSSNAGTTSFIDTQSQIAKDTQARADEIKKEQEALSASTKPFLDKILGGTSPDTVRTNAQIQTGIDPTTYFADQKAKIAEIDTLNQDYNKTKAEMETMIANAQNNLASTGSISSTVAKIQRDYTPKLNLMSANINAKAATLQALQGNFNSAQDFVNQAVQDATATQKYNYDLYNTLYTNNKDIIDALDKPYADAFTTKLNMDKANYDNAVSDATKVGTLLVANPQAGILITDSLETAYTKIANAPKTNNQIIGSAETGYKNVISDSSGKIISVTPVPGGGGGGNTSIYKFTSTQLNEGSSKAGLDLTSFKSLNPDVQNFFVTTSKTSVDAMNQAIKDKDAVNLIDSSNLTQSVKDYFKSKVTIPTSNSSLGNPLEGGFFNNLWGGIKNLFS